MRDEQINRVLQAWKLTEQISGGEVDTKRSQCFVGKISEQAQKAKNDEHSRQKGTSSLIYLGEYRKQSIRDEIQNDLFQDNAVVQNEDKAIGYSLILKVNDDWTFQDVFVPYAALYYLMLREGNVNAALHGEGYEAFQEKLQQSLQEIVDEPIETVSEILRKVDIVVVREFKLAHYDGNLRGVFNYRTEPALLNSFYIDDLDRVMSTKTDDKLISAYIRHNDSTKQMDVDKNWPFISSLLRVDNLPDGRWPSKVENFQSLMQQVAINIIRDKAIKKNNLRTVNGSPGTGKTTLLKDVFADMVVDQAKQMVKLTRPDDGFTKSNVVKLNMGKIYCYQAFRLIPELQGFGAIVTSNNNSAVANISKEFPDKKSIQKHDESTKGLNPTEPDRYRAELEKIDYFSDLANEILDTRSAWGLFAVPMGSKKNQKKVFKSLNRRTTDTQLKLALKLGRDTDSWQAARENFNRVLNIVNESKRRLNKSIQDVQGSSPQKMEELRQQVRDLNVAGLENDLTVLDANLRDQMNGLELIPKRRFLFFWKRATPEYLRADKLVQSKRKEREQLVKRLNQSRKAEEALTRKLNEVRKQHAKIDALNDTLKADKTYVATEQYWQQDADAIQKQLPNNSSALQDYRAQLFIAAMRLRKAFVCGAGKQITNSWKIFEMQESLMFPKEENILRESFQIMQLLVPVMSTTLASFGRMFGNMGENSIDNVFIDEAGQATPVSAVGAVWRAKRLVAVGDPAQIEPVVTTNAVTLRTIAHEFHIDDKYLAPTASVQQLADMGGIYGTRKQDKSWVGIPLWVHRRCSSPMFDIANKISYENKMVQEVSRNVEQISSRWINSVGKATKRQFVPEQVISLSKALILLLKQGKELDDIFVISPFTAVVSGIKETIGQYLTESCEENTLKKWLRKNVGTVHTFQGKEAKVVFFVVGTDQATDSGADWAFSKPNLLNVAVTRVKKEFYVIGDRKRLRNKQFMNVVDQMLK